MNSFWSSMTVGSKNYFNYNSLQWNKTGTCCHPRIAGVIGKYTKFRMCQKKISIQ